MAMKTFFGSLRAVAFLRKPFEDRALLEALARSTEPPRGDGQSCGPDDPPTTSTP
jgi:hypothetical protein